MIPRLGDGARRARIGVVTDSTACLTPELVEPFGELLCVVALNVTLGDTTFVEGHDVTSEQVAQAQAAGSNVMTSRPSPGRFVEVYRELAEAGCSAIVSIHVSEALSSTVSSARLAGVESPVDVTVVDSRTIGMALGFGVLAAARSAALGAGLDAVVEAAQHTLSSSHTAFYVDSLEPLRRGGRIGRAGALFGSALAIKPLLHVQEGAIAPLARVRTTRKAITRLTDWAAGHAHTMPDNGRVCAVHSLERADLARLLTDGLIASTKDGGAGEAGSEQDGDPAVEWRWAMGPLAVPLGASVTAHVGPGAVAVVVAQMPEADVGQIPPSTGGHAGGPLSAPRNP